MVPVAAGGLVGLRRVCGDAGNGIAELFDYPVVSPSAPGGFPREYSRARTVNESTDFVRSAFVLSPPPVGVLVHERSATGKLQATRLVMVVGTPSSSHLAPTPPGRPGFVPVKSLAGTECYAAAALAIVTANEMSERSLPTAAAQAMDLDDGEAAGEVERSRDVAYWNQLKSHALASHAALKAVLNAVPPSDPDYDFMQECASRVDAVDMASLDDVSPGLRVRRPPNPASASALPFVSRFLPPITARDPQPPAQRTSYKPLGLTDIYEADALAEIDGWLCVNDANTRLTERDGPDARLAPLPVLVIGQDRFKPEARGIVWSRQEDGTYAPLDLRASPSTDLNHELLADELPDWPDRALVGGLADGLQYRATSVEGSLATVLSPHLRSLGMHRDSFRAVDKEVKRLALLGYQHVRPGHPYAPMSLRPQGTVERKLEKDRPRRISDGTAPRAHPPLSVNKAVGLKSASAAATVLAERVVEVGGVLARTTPAKWPREVKPDSVDTMHDEVVLRGASDAGFGTIFTFSDDMADQFMQLPLHPMSYWYSAFQWLDLDAVAGAGHVFGSELRVGYGYSPASNYAQRFIEYFLALVRKRMDALQEPKHAHLLATLPSGDSRVRWLRARRQLSLSTRRREDRLYSALGYTDDVWAMVVGIDAYVDWLRSWRSVVVDLRVRMALARKRQLGTSGTFIGVNHHPSAGITSVQTGKVLRLNEMLGRVWRGDPVTFDEWRSTTGLLEHVVISTGGDRPSMYHCYGIAHATGMQGGPRSRLHVEPELRERVGEWLRRLRATAGCFSVEVVIRRVAPASSSPSGVLVRWRTDAGKEGARVPGLGGYMHGYFFAYALELRDLALHITALEFVAAILGCVAFARFAEGLRVQALVDAESIYHILSKQRASSGTMQALHLAYLNEQSAQLPESIEWDWLAGESNVLSDAPSRGELDTLHALASHLGITLRRIDVDTDARRLLDLAHDYVRRAALAGDEPAAKRSKPTNAVRYGEADKPGPAHRAWPAGGVSRSASGLVATRRPAARRAHAAPSVSEDRGAVGTAPTLAARRREPGARRPATAALQPAATSRSAAPASAPKGVAAHGTARPPSAGAPPFTAARPLSTSMSVANRRKRSRGSALDAGPAPRRSKARLPPQHRPPSSVSIEPPRSAPSDRAASGSRWALRPCDPAQARQIASYIERSASHAVPTSTLAKESTSWNYWERYCREVWGTDPRRLNRDAHTGLDREAERDEEVLMAGFAVWLIGQVAPRSRRDSSARPDSLFAHVYSIRRIHLRIHGIVMVRPACMRQLHRAMLKDHVDANGREALLPNRKEPMTVGLLRKLLDVPSGTRVGRAPLDWSSTLGVSLAAMLCTAFEGGFRKSELALPAGATFDPMRASRGSLCWLLQGRYVLAPTRQQLLSIAPGDYAVLTPPPSKADQFGVFFGGRPLYLPHAAGDPTNAAARLATLELTCPVPAVQRRTTPLFISDARRSAIKASAADRLLAGLLVHAIESAERRRHYSWHSFRIGLACALLAAGAPPETIQALCRWKSKESLVVYARLNPESYGAWIAKARLADVTSIQTTNLPPIDDHTYAAVLSQMVDHDPANTVEA